jgi:hypothetical protein
LPLPLQRYLDLLTLISRPDLSAKLLQENLSAGLPEAAAAAASAAADAVGTAANRDQPGGWPAAAVAAMALSEAQRQALAAAWRRHGEAAAQRAQRKQELLAAIRQGFLQVGRPCILALVCSCGPERS